MPTLYGNSSGKILAFKNRLHFEGPGPPPRKQEVTEVLTFKNTYKEPGSSVG